jgi:hypothetical protein
MKGIITRPRNLLLVVALTVAAALCTVSTADAASSASDSVVPAAPSNLTAKAVGTTSVQLTWTNNAGNQSGVVISLDGEESVDLQGATVSSYTWNGLSPNTQYWFYVASKIYGTPGDHRHINHESASDRSTDNPAERGTSLGVASFSNLEATPDGTRWFDP